MNQSKKNLTSKKKSKKRSNNNSNNQESSSCNNSNKQSNNKSSKLCAFSSVDYIVLASTLAIALGEELSDDDINILASFFAVLSDELALIASISACNNEDDETSVFVPPIPDLAVSSSRNKKNIKKKK